MRKRKYVWLEQKQAGVTSDKLSISAHVCSINQLHFRIRNLNYKSYYPYIEETLSSILFLYIFRWGRGESCVAVQTIFSKTIQRFLI